MDPSVEKPFAIELVDEECSTGMFVSVAILPSLLPCDIKLSPVNLRVSGDAVSDIAFLVIVGEYFSKLSVDRERGVG